MRFARRFKGIRGTTVAELAAVAALLSGLGASAFSGSKSMTNKGGCAANLKQLGKAVKMYSLDNFGKLPQCAFYPGSKAKTDPKSICKKLGEYVKSPSVFLCPGAPKKINGYGLAYVWNDALNGQSLRKVANPSKTWMICDVHAAAAAKKISTGKVPAAHSGGYNILYVDGMLGWSKTPPKIAVK